MIGLGFKQKRGNAGEDQVSETPETKLLYRFIQQHVSGLGLGSGKTGNAGGHSDTAACDRV